MAVNNLEKKLTELEDNLKALKATYSISGGLARMYVQKDTMPATGVDARHHLVRLKFTPRYGMGQNNLISFFVTLSAVYYGIVSEMMANFVVKPQSGNGEIILEIYNVMEGETIKIITAGTSPGTFTRIS